MTLEKSDSLAGPAETISSTSIQRNYGAFQDRARVQTQEVTVRGRPAIMRCPRINISD